MRKPFIPLLALFLLSLSQFAWADDFDDIRLKVTQVSGNIYVLEGVGGFAGGNIAVSAGKDGLLIVDDQFAPMADKIHAALADIGPGKLRFVLNTHWHGDHTGGNARFADDATIIAHDNVRKRLQAAQENMFGKSPAQPEQAWPVITFDDSLSIHLNGEEVRFIHFANGHTDGDGVVYFSGANVVHVGDHFFVDAFPFVDINSGGNVIGYTANVKKTIDSMADDVKIVPGHGRIATLEDYKRFYRMLVETTDYVKAKISAGRSLQEIQTEGLPAQWESWGNGFIKPAHWIEFIFQSVSG